MASNVRNLISQATFLSEEEREMLSGILAFWPKEEMDRLAEALSGEIIATVAQSEAKNTVPEKEDFEERIKNIQNPPSGSNLADLKNRLSSQTVDFKSVKSKKTESVVPNPQPIQKTANGRGVKFIETSEDLSTLTLEDLRTGDFRQNLKGLLSKIFEAAKNERTLAYSVIQEFIKSPVYQQYIQSGIKSMENKNFDLHFTREEFEHFTDFKNYLDSLV